MTQFEKHIPDELGQKLITIGFNKTNPTYYEVFDWFSSEKGIVISLEPFFTFALANNIAFTWKISYCDNQFAKMTHITEEDVYKSGGFGGSFCLTADAAIEFAIGLGDRRITFTEIDIEQL